MKASLPVAAALLIAAALAGSVRAGDRDARVAQETCSASGLRPGRAIPGLPRAVASMRLRIISAARRCDFATLTRLGDEHGRGLTFSYGASRSASSFWRAHERSGPEPRPMEALVKVLAMPFAPVRADGTRAARGRARFYVWPSAHRRNASERDWQALRTLYTRAQIERMRRGGTGYLGYRVGIRPAGDWQYFVAGD